MTVDELATILTTYPAEMTVVVFVNFAVYDICAVQEWAGECELGCGEMVRLEKGEERT